MKHLSGRIRGFPPKMSIIARIRPAALICGAGRERHRYAPSHPSEATGVI
jgi:hypothetical protein